MADMPSQEGLLYFLIGIYNSGSRLINFMCVTITCFFPNFNKKINRVDTYVFSGKLGLFAKNGTYERQEIAIDCQACLVRMDKH